MKKKILKKNRKIFIPYLSLCNKKLKSGEIIEYVNLTLDGIQLIIKVNKHENSNNK